MFPAEGCHGDEALVRLREMIAANKDLAGVEKLRDTET